MDIQAIERIIPSVIKPTVKKCYDSSQFFKTMFKSKSGMGFLDLKLDTNNACNLKCKYCYRYCLEKETPIFMSMENFKKIADELFPISSSVSLSCATEPFMSKHFIECLDIAKKYNIPYLFYVTNGQLFTNEIIEKTITTGVNEIAISIDAVKKETYEEIRENASYEKLINNLTKIHELKKKYNSINPKVRINYTVFKENATEVPLFIKKYHRYIDSILVNHMNVRFRNELNPYNRMSEEEFKIMENNAKEMARRKGIGIHVSFNDIRPKTFLCRVALTYRNINSKGDITLCTKKIIGNLFEKSYNEIMQENRNLLKKMYRCKDDYCIQCMS